MASVGKNAVILRAVCSVGKEEGFLTLSKRKLNWMKSSSTEPDISISCSTLTNLLASKAGTKPLKLKVVHNSGDAKTFVFPAEDDYGGFRTALSDVVTRNKEKAAAVAANAAKAAGAGPEGDASAMADVVPGQGSSYTRAGQNQKRRLNKNELKAAVLKRSPELARLHADLVRNGHITEVEFWEGREHLILAEAAADSQRKGKTSLIVDPRPVRDETGKATTKLSNETIEDIFEEFPVVRRAYDENVPRRLTEHEFWTRYLVSKLASRNSASARGAASEHTVQSDPIFDKYLEKEDDEPTPRHERDGVGQMFIDLDATEQDHPDSGNTQDVPMQAGRQKQAIPLIRRFNEHSERLLNSALGQEPPSRRHRMDAETFEDDLYEDQIVIDELQPPQPASVIPLEMKDVHQYLGAGGSANEDASTSSRAVDIKSLLPALVGSIGDWATGMAAVRLDRKASEDALTKMTNNVRSRLESRLRRSDFPEALLEEMTALQKATSEFLRQFWSAVDPPPEQGVLSVAAPTQLETREEKMAGYLRMTEGKIEAIVRTANSLGADPGKVHTAFEHTVNAVNAALATHSSRAR